MNVLHKPALIALALSLFGSLLLTGCNTVRGVGKDVERAGEKIQQNAR